MDLSRQLKNAIATGNLLFGQRQSKAACASGNAKLVLVAANCPEEYTTALRASTPKLRFIEPEWSIVNWALLVVSPSRCPPSPCLTQGTAT